MLPEATAVPEAPALQQEGKSLLARGRALVIKTSEDFQKAGGELVEVARFIKNVKEKFARPKKLADEAHKAIVKLENEVLAPAKSAETILRSGISAYSIEQDKLRREAQARMEQEEKDRRETEALDVADALASVGDSDAAAEVIDQAIAEPAPIVEIPRERAAGISTRKTWKYRVRDFSKVKDDFKVMNETKAGQLVRAMGPDAIAVIGAGSIDVWEEATVVARAS